MDGEITTDDVERLLEGDDPPLVVDIRVAPAFDRAHIPDSVNVPFQELPTRVASLEDADHIVTVCPHGQSSQQAARLIKSYEGTEDARVDSMKGGLEAWDGPLVSDRDETSAEEGPEAPF